MARIQAPSGKPAGRIKVGENKQPSPNQKRPKFSLEHLLKSHCLSNCTKDEKAALADRLHQMSQLTWEQIQQSSRKGQGSETIARTSINEKIPSSITEDTNILSFRFFGNAPMVGFRQDEVFFIVWLDRAFDVYDH